jgi:arylsulfatase A-like enzyme
LTQHHPYARVYLHPAEVSGDDERQEQLEEAGIAQSDDSIGGLSHHLEDIGEADNTIVTFTTFNGAKRRRTGSPGRMAA